MADVKDAIEEMIEESYLLGLSEEEILADFSRFIDTCYTVIQDNVKSREALSRLAENLAREKTSTRIEDHAPDLGKVAAKDDQRVCAEKAARRKRMVLKAIADYDPPPRPPHQRAALSGRFPRRSGAPQVQGPSGPRPRLGALRPALAPSRLHHRNRAHVVSHLFKILTVCIWLTGMDFRRLDAVLCQGWIVIWPVDCADMASVPISVHL